MDCLIPVLNKLQDVFAAVGARDTSIQLPQIVVVGSQSSGKSSVIESIVGRDFLPRGNGIVTRRPLILQLIYTPEDSDKRMLNNQKIEGDWGVFKHAKNRIFTDFEEIKKEIEEETDRTTGTNKGISFEPISLKIFSHKVVNLSLVDLPGLTKVAVGDQPEDIEDQIKGMIYHYISNPNAIILAVTPANQDFATSEALKISRDVDKDGLRTLAILTKLDLMDAGTDAMDVFMGRVIQVRLGIIGVVNRSQMDINNKKSIEDSLKDELAFIQRTYPALASKNGTPYLVKMLNKLLIHHIRLSLPSLKQRINTLQSQFQSQLNSFGEPLKDKRKTLLQILTRFTHAYTSTIEGNSTKIETTELCGGARINYIFHETFAKVLDEIDPLKNLTEMDILTAIRNATGTRSVLYVPEICFELLVKQQIQKLEEPSLHCVELVHEELLRIVQHCGVNVQQEMQRFPMLFDRINICVATALKERVTPTKEFVENLISIELAYVNAKHPDFSNACSYSLQQVDGDLPKRIKKVTVKDEDPHIRSNSVGRTENTTEENQPHPQENKDNVEKVENNQVDGKDRNSYFGWLVGKQNAVKGETKLINNQTGEVETILTTQTPERLSRQLTTREKKDCKTIERLIKSYFNIVRKNIQDSVPKAIMHFLVNYVKENLHSELVRSLYDNASMDELLQESETIAERRRHCSDMLESLNKAIQILGEIRETHIRL
ncbi:Dynamin-1-like protein [Strongyloides ratti]|uniref:dynamin GTPase n=1 Tax=Strongyloides ratti TaxID=34506 RepID=A0A090MMT8_STRRB|nr:Dynamin-1-like protein [Strongyloides ratti]CEF59341.1 Dynamin-1-like protein [Strongyloides ratti]